jgi:biopolymer transport protein TolQ
MEELVSVAPSSTGLSYWHLVTQASLLVQLVMTLLLVASLTSWSMIFQKWFVIKGAQRSADRFEDDFWAGGDVNRLYSEWAGKRNTPTGMANIFVAGYREYSRLTNKGGIERGEILDGVQRAMRVALSRETDQLETSLSFLATVGSTSPYVGLFGTVWGIMNSFRALGVQEHASISTVAPGIAEALIATAMGLFAAIPAVIAYNRYSNEVERLVNRYEVFMEEFLSIVSRQAG